MTQPWPPRQLPMYGPRWNRNGSRCTAPGCSEPRQAIAMVPRPVADGMGPQGAWKCEAGHCGWVWPAECSADKAAK